MEILIKLLLVGGPLALIIKIWLDARKEHKSIADMRAAKRRAKIKALVGDNKGREELDDKMARIGDLYDKYANKYGDPRERIKRKSDTPSDKRD